MTDHAALIREVEKAIETYAWHQGTFLGDVLRDCRDALAASQAREQRLREAGMAILADIGETNTCTDRLHCRICGMELTEPHLENCPVPELEAALTAERP